MTLPHSTFQWVCIALAIVSLLIQPETGVEAAQMFLLWGILHYICEATR